MSTHRVETVKAEAGERDTLLERVKQEALASVVCPICRAGLGQPCALPAIAGREMHEMRFAELRDEADPPKPGQAALERKPDASLPSVKSKLITLFSPSLERWAISVVDKRELIVTQGPLFFAWVGQYSTHIFKVGPELLRAWMSELAVKV